MLNRLPMGLCRAHLGWLLGNRFLLLTHMGRNSGRPRQAVLEVMRYEKDDDAYIVASGWGERADWVRNIERTPKVVVQVGRRRADGTAVRLSAERAEQEFRDYAKNHPLAFRTLARKILGGRQYKPEEGFRLLARVIPVFALRAAPASCPAETKDV